MLQRGIVLFNSTDNRLNAYDGSRWTAVVNRVAAADLPSQTGSAGPANLVSGGAGGMYRISVYVKTITPGSGSMTVRIGWSDGVARTRDVIANFDQSVSNGEADAEITLYLEAGQNITYQTLGVAGPTRYMLRIRGEAL